MAKSKRSKTKIKSQRKKIKFFIVGFLFYLSLIFIDSSFNIDIPYEIDKIYRFIGLNNSVEISENEVSVHFIDIGQGDSILIKTGRENILIDGGDIKTSDNLIKYLDKESVDTIDLMVATHPHADHIGGLIGVIKRKQVKSIIMPDIPKDLIPTTKVYENFLTEIINRDIKVTKPNVNNILTVNNGKLTILSPISNDYKNINNYSITLRLDVKEKSFLFTGDIEKEVERQFSKNNTNIDVDVLKVAHHGSNTSSTTEFIMESSPKYAIFSLANGNRYNHPNEDVVNRFFENETIMFSTNKNGNIVFITDGENMDIRKDR
ncbi:MAG: ComEC/Rec2 family competence protein [Oscillospiraceae bacterium]